jgi:8-oxo-dGTP pyrophosphatase MutT (NUDIX family)
MREVWKPNVTVAAVCEQDGKFLLVEEETDAGLRLNQPAGHLEQGEALINAVVRETLEETAYSFSPEFLVGIYSWQHTVKDITFLRFAFAGKVQSHDASRTLDAGIVRALWLTEDEIRRETPRHRTPLLTRCIADYRAGRRYPLELLVHYS